jgi:hypothetical protein
MRILHRDTIYLRRLRDLKSLRKDLIFHGLELAGVRWRLRIEPNCQASGHIPRARLIIELSTVIFGGCSSGLQVTKYLTTLKPTNLIQDPTFRQS